MIENPPTEDAALRARHLHEGLARFPAELFQFDARIRTGWLSDRYFLRTAATLRHAGRDPVATLQVFAKQRGVLAGIYEAVRLFQTQLAPGYDPRDLVVDTLLEGDAINRGGADEWEPVMHVTGRYRGFASLATFQQRGEFRHHVFTTRFRRLVTTLAVCLQNRADLFVEADLLRRLHRFGRQPSGRAEQER